jgi:ATP-dependent Clp protease adaptor protein ClpS
MFNIDNSIKIQEQVSIKEKQSEANILIVWNDEVNTFDHVIDTLIDVCNHDSAQAEQCTWMIHTSGKCDVQRGSFDKLRPMAEAIIDRGIGATIE